MSKATAIVVAALVTVALVGAVWADHFHVRASHAEVMSAIDARFGSGPPIICVAQDDNHSRWNCRSARWGDDPICRPVTVSWRGAITISDDTPVCE
jgi:hypothetical protein